MCVTQVVIQDTAEELPVRRNSYRNRRDVGEIRLNLHLRRIDRMGEGKTGERSVKSWVI